MSFSPGDCLCVPWKRALTRAECSGVDLVPSVHTDRREHMVEKLMIDDKLHKIVWDTGVI